MSVLPDINSELQDINSEFSDFFTILSSKSSHNSDFYFSELQILNNQYFAI